MSSEAGSSQDGTPASPPRSNVTALTDIELQQALQPYPIAPLARAVLASDGIENSNYLIATQDERQYVFTILEQPSFSSHKDYVALLDCCTAAGLPVPSVIRTKDQATQVQVNGKPALLSRFLAGSHASNPTHLQLESVGRFLGRLHRVDYQPEDGLTPHPRNTQWLRESLAELSPRLGFQQRELLTQAIVACEQLFERQDIRSLPWGTVHGDLFRDNVLFTRQGMSGVLDFHHAASGYYLFDLAVAANDWCREANGLLDMDRTLQMLRAYHQQKLLSELEVWWFGAFGLFAATVFYTARLRTQKLEQTVRSKDPIEMEQLVAGYLSHPPQLAWRLFR